MGNNLLKIINILDVNNCDAQNLEKASQVDH